MSDTLYPAGTRVVRARSAIVGTSKGSNQFQDLYKPTPQITVEFDDGRAESVPEIYLRPATEDDEARSAERIQQAEEANRRAAERTERIRQQREENNRKREQQKAEALEAKEEARRQAEREHSEAMREANARIYGLQSLLKITQEKKSS